MGRCERFTDHYTFTAQYINTMEHYLIITLLLAIIWINSTAWGCSSSSATATKEDMAKIRRTLQKSKSRGTKLPHPEDFWIPLPVVYAEQICGMIHKIRLHQEREKNITLNLELKPRKIGHLVHFLRPQTQTSWKVPVTRAVAEEICQSYLSVKTFMDEDERLVSEHQLLQEQSNFRSQHTPSNKLLWIVGVSASILVVVLLIYLIWLDKINAYARTFCFWFCTYTY